MLGHSFASCIIKSESRSIPPLALGSCEDEKLALMMSKRYKRTIIDDHGDKASISDLGPKGLESFSVVPQSACKVSACNNDSVVRTGTGSLQSKFYCFSRASGTRTSDNRNMVEAGVVEYFPGNLYEFDPLRVGQMNGLPHSASYKW